MEKRIKTRQAAFYILIVAEAEGSVVHFGGGVDDDATVLSSPSVDSNSQSPYMARKKTASGHLEPIFRKPCCMCVTWSWSPSSASTRQLPLSFISLPLLLTHSLLCCCGSCMRSLHKSSDRSCVLDLEEKEASSREDRKCKLYRHDPSLLQCRRVGRDIRGVDKHRKMGNMQKYHDTPTQNTRCCCFSLWHSIYSDDDASLSYSLKTSKLEHHCHHFIHIHLYHRYVFPLVPNKI